MAAFAFRLARKATGHLKASYKKDDRSRPALMKIPAFQAAFTEAKAHIQDMDLRYIAEDNPVRQALLEIFA